MSNSWRRARAGMFSSYLRQNLNFYLKKLARLNFKTDLGTLHSYPEICHTHFTSTSFYLLNTSLFDCQSHSNITYNYTVIFLFSFHNHTIVPFYLTNTITHNRNIFKCPLRRASYLYHHRAVEAEWVTVSINRQCSRLRV